MSSNTNENNLRFNTEYIKNEADKYEKIILNQIGTYINNKRKESNLTIRELNSITGVSLAVLSDLENAKSMPRIETFLRIAEALEIRHSQLFEHMKPVSTFSVEDKETECTSNKYDQLATFMAGLGYNKEDTSEMVNYLKFIDHKKHIED